MPFPKTATIPGDVMARRVGDETVLLDLASGNYYGLDPVGARIWQLLSDGKTLAQACEVLLAEYDVTRAALEQDVERLVAELGAKGLLTVA
ncbi:MAG: PqqD family protein [Ramlibacter sp.]|nr:PqqD family protein [Ramlibacter sp.]